MHLSDHRSDLNAHSLEVTHPSRDVPSRAAHIYTTHVTMSRVTFHPVLDSMYFDVL